MYILYSEILRVQKVLNVDECFCETTSDSNRKSNNDIEFTVLLRFGFGENSDFKYQLVRPKKPKYTNVLAYVFLFGALNKNTTTENILV